MLENVFKYSDLKANSWRDVKDWSGELRSRQQLDSPQCLFVA